MTNTMPVRSFLDPRPGPACPECHAPTRWLTPPIGRWICPDCAISWRYPSEYGLRENPTTQADTTAAPALKESRS